jgi:DNA-binding NarL/FixJ family response regulator
MRAAARHPLVVCEAHPGHGEEVAEELVAFGYEVRCCADEESLIDAVATRHPSAVVYELHHQLPVDLAILALLRRVLPGVPLVLLAGERAAPAPHALRAMRPAVVAHEPVSRDQLHAAVRAAVRRSRAHGKPARHAKHAPLTTLD